AFMRLRRPSTSCVVAVTPTSAVSRAVSISSSSASSSCGLRENRPPMLRAKALPRRRARQPAAPAGAAGAVASASGGAGGTGGVVAAGAGGASVAGATGSGFLRRKKLTIVGTIAQNGAHGSTGSTDVPMKRRPPARPRTRSGGGRSGVVRIIGGHWRGTRLPVADLDGLRPTPDRVRETLFNWWQPMLPGAGVLDLFAGSGALGLEALSRGAAEALLVERDAGVAERLREAVGRLRAGDRAHVLQADALALLRTPLHGR